MSTKITSYYVPNKIANSYVASKRTNTGAYAYDEALADVGMETQAAVQSLNKSYSNVINDAYTNYLNSKRSIAASTLGQGYKEAYIQKQEEALQENMAQAGLSAKETKQDILKQQAEQLSTIGNVFKDEVVNMERVDKELGNYMEYLKTVSKDDVSYYDAIVKGKGLENIDTSIGVKAQDIYDALYNAAPLDYKTDKDEAALNWENWLKTQIKTEKDQAWYDWYVGSGGYEQFQDAYKKGQIGTVAEYMAEQAEKQRQEQLAQQAQQAQRVEEYNRKQRLETEYNTKRSDIDTKIDKINKPMTLSKDVSQNSNNIFNYGQKVGLTNDEIINTIKKFYPNVNSSLELAELFGNFNSSVQHEIYRTLINLLNETGKSKGYKQSGVDISFDDWYTTNSKK